MNLFINRESLLTSFVDVKCQQSKQINLVVLITKTSYSMLGYI